MPVVRLDPSDRATAQKLLAVQRAAYAVEAGLIGSTDIPQLHESAEDLAGAPLEWLGIVEEGEILAALGYRVLGQTIDIDRLIVSPHAMRRGHGSRLLRELGTQFTITVSTGTENGPACELYRRHGFSEVGRHEPVPGLSVTSFIRRSEDDG